MPSVYFYIVKEIASAVQSTGSTKDTDIIRHILRTNPQWGAFEVAECLGILRNKE
jgi:hypothetical protein